LDATWLSLAIALAATAGVIARPFDWPEAVWAVAGAVLLVVLGLMPVSQALSAVGKGGDVYLFLTGMMLLSEVGRREGLFDWAAVLAVNHAKGSPARLFMLIYGVGIVTTTFLSNDATAVVLTPAVIMAARKAKVKALPLLFVCAFIANAASFVLPISNPANIVLYANKTPPLGAWLAQFALPSLVSIVATFALLRWTQRHALQGRCESDLPHAPLTASAWIALVGMALTAIALTLVSAFDRPLGLPTAILGIATAAAVLVKEKQNPWNVVKDISWGVLPLVAGLFVLVEALDRAGVTRWIAHTLQSSSAQDETGTAAVAGALLAVVSNLMNNLPAGLVTSSALLQAHVGDKVTDALLIGVDLGPNLSITGSLATILWLSAIRREGETVSFTDFLKVGAIVMPVSLAATLAARLLT
jgi:arsenical pump membrane protein